MQAPEDSGKFRVLVFLKYTTNSSIEYVFEKQSGLPQAPGSCQIGDIIQ